MTRPVAEIIKNAGIEKLQALTGIPIRTLYRWAENNKVPGRGVAHEWRLNQLMDAVEKIATLRKPVNASRLDGAKAPKAKRARPS